MKEREGFFFEANTNVIQKRMKGKQLNRLKISSISMSIRYDIAEINILEDGTII